MVEFSLRKFMNKYPYFLNKNEGSNFYHVSDVNNRHFRRLYNDLFKVYESFHITKKVLVWKEQDKPYEYQMNFIANYDKIKDVTIYKNDIPIYFKEYDRSDEKNDFIYTYKCKYLINKGNVLSAYACTECGDIYLSNNIQENCSNCGNNTYQKLKVYKCIDCGEIYFDKDELKNCTINNHPDSLMEVDIFECDECGEIYFTNTPPNKCTSCNAELNPIIINDFNIQLNKNDKIILEDNRNIMTTDTEVEKENSYKRFYFKVPDYNESLIISILLDDEVIETIRLDEDNNWEAYSSDFLVDNDYKIISSDENIDISSDIEEIYIYTDLINGKSYNEENNFQYNNLAVIPDDKFIIKINTYDEYTIIKGFPENDDYNYTNNGTYIPDIFDHDPSLDELGALNNIPRKEYKIVSEEDYPFTEPPFNNRLTEDDYHYMMRMLEYNLRLWSMQDADYNIHGYSSRDFVERFNPVTLELWKIYGIPSQLVNRERYLLKVFDENKHPFDVDTGLVKCWTPEKWEHKDRFCDGSSNYGEYFFVTPDTVRPIKGQSVNFNFSVLNSLAESINEEYYVIPYKIKINSEDIVERVLLYDNPIHSDKFRLSYHAIDLDKPTILLFEAYYLNGELLGSVKVILNARTKPDWYVKSDANIRDGVIIDDYIGDGSREYPFLTLQEALDKVNNSLNYICLLGNITINAPLMINQNTIIVGEDSYINGNRFVPRIFQKDMISSTQFNRVFFKIIGNKKCSLILSNLRLISGEINSFIGINTWLNNSPVTNIFEDVIVHGGPVNLDINFNRDEYFPFDFVDMELFLTKKDGTVLENNQIDVYYDDLLVKSLFTNSEGKCSFKFNIDEDDISSYQLRFINRSDTFFENNMSKLIECNCSPHYYYPSVTDDFVILDICNYDEGDRFKLYSRGNFVKDIILDTSDDLINYSDDSFKYSYNNIAFGKYILYSTIDDGMYSSVKEEWIIESKIPISHISQDVTFIKNVVFNDITGELSYDTFNLSRNPKMSDLDGIVLNIKSFDSGRKIEVDTFNVDISDLDDTELLYSDAVVLKDALVDMDLVINVDDGFIDGERLGDFWNT